LLEGAKMESCDMRRMRHGQWIAVFLLSAASASAETLDEALARLKAVGREGAGSEAAANAWKELVRRGPEALPEILRAMDNSNAANWLRTAGDAIAERAAAAGKPLPVEALERFIGQTRHNGAARRLAYEWLCRVDAKTPARLLPGMLQDPSHELRRDAVDAVLKQARSQLDKGDKAAARAAYRHALTGACDKDHVDLIVKELDKLGVKVDIAAHFGFVRQWLLAAPFDNHNEAGFSVAYPPEKGVDPKAVYKGKDGKQARWTSSTTTDSYGAVNLNNVLGKQSGVVAYAYAVIESPKERLVQIRVGSLNAIKIFLNGKEIFHCEEYHHGIEIDQYIANATLKAGRNELLLKVCQNEQKEEWAQDWVFQARLCDAVGTAIPFTQTALEIDNPRNKEKAKP
jgi:hypothetical protein